MKQAKNFSGYEAISRVVLFQLVLAVSLLYPRVGYSESEEWLYVMSSGDSIWTISEKYLGSADYVGKLVQRNNIADPKKMPPGTKVRIPKKWLKFEEATVNAVNVVGEVSYKTTEMTEFKPLHQGILLSAGDQITVGHDGNVVLKFVDGTTLFLGKGSVATLARVNRLSNSDIGDTQLNLAAGRSENHVTTPGTRFEITTPSTSAVVRGTNFRLVSDQSEDNVSRLEVLGGGVAISGAGERITIPAGFGTAVTQGQPPLRPVRLLSAPVLLQPSEFSKRIPLDFEWEPIAGAKGYRIQVASAEADNTLLLDEKIDKPRFSTADLEDGHYLVRVRAIDSIGLEGEEKVQSLELDARPAPPFVVAPAPGDIVRSKSPYFEWSRPIDGRSYHLQVSRAEDFSELHLDLPGLTDVNFTPEQWEPGKYFWRLATETDDETGPFSEAYAFTLHPAPDAPAISGESNEEGYSLRWPSGSEGQKFRVQIASDSDFKKVITETLVEEPQWQMSRPVSLVYFRVRTIDVDGFEGAWSSAQQIAPPPPPWYKFGGIALLFLFIAL